MSQPIYCSAPVCGAEADVIIGDMHTGDQTPLCFPHLFDWCGAFRDQMVDAEVEQPDAEAVARIAAVSAPPQSRLEAVIDANGHDTGETIVQPDFPATAKVVRKHTSKSRQAYEARRAEKAAIAERMATETANAALGPSEGVTEATEADG